MGFCMVVRGWGLVHRIRYLVEKKLTESNASSPETAVTADEAELTITERRWLLYLAGGMSRIKKTEDDRYYLRQQ